MEYLIFGAVLGLLVASLALNGALWFTRYKAADSWRERARAAEDAKKAAELRSAQQIDAMLDRVRSSALTLDAAEPDVTIDPTARKFFADDQTDDFAWNDWQEEQAR